MLNGCQMDVKWISSGNYSPLHDSCFIKRTNIIGQALILSSMTLVLGTVAEKVAVQLLQMIFCDRDVGKGTEDGLHDFGVSGDFLFIASVEFLDLQLGE